MYEDCYIFHNFKGSLKRPNNAGKFSQWDNLLFCTSVQVDLYESIRNNDLKIIAAEDLFKHFILAQFYYEFYDGENWRRNDNRSRDLDIENRTNEDFLQFESDIYNSTESYSENFRPFGNQINQNTKRMQIFWKFILTFNIEYFVPFVPNQWAYGDNNEYSSLEGVKLDWANKYVRPY